MRLRRRHGIAVLGSIALIGGCEADRQLGPDVDPLLAAGGNSTTAAPSSLTSTAVSFSEIQLAWSDNSTNESGFDIHRSTNGATGTYTPWSTASAGATTTSDYGVSASAQYCYKVRAYITRGRKQTYSAFSNTTCATTSALPVPPAPTNVNTRPVNNNIEISWAATSDPEYGFRVERSATAAEPWVTVSSVASYSRTAGDWSRPSEQTVCYRIIALNRYGGSPPSAIDCTAPPAAPTALSVTAIATTTIDLAWQSNSNVEDGYELRRYGDDYVNVLVATLPADAQSYRVEGLVPDTRYTFWVIALKDGGYSNPSDYVSAATAPAGPPPAPSAITASPNGSNAIYVSWSGASPSTVSFRLERSFDNLSWSEIATLYDYGFVDPGVPSEERRYYRVIALNAQDDASAPSAVASTAPPAAPSNLTTEYSSDLLTLTWRDNSQVEDGYEVWTIYYEWVCGWDECYYQGTPYPAYWLEASTTSHVMSIYEELYGVVAVKDGGYSDFAFPGAAAAAAQASSSRVIPPGAKRRVSPPRLTPNTR